MFDPARSHHGRRLQHSFLNFTSLLMLVAMATVITAQEYLPPKPGGKKTEEPTAPANYDFSYEVQDSSLSVDFGHNEKRMNDQAKGSYHVLLPDGRMQVVEYEAGPNGYRPQITYMGTAQFPPGPGEGYNYNAASNQKLVRRPPPPPLPLSAPSSTLRPKGKDSFENHDS